MVIRYLGHSCFYISGGVSVVTDPFDGIGYPLERVKADYVLCSHDHFDHNAVNAVDYTYKMTLKSAENFLSAGFDDRFHPFEKIRLEAISSYHDTENGKKRGKNMIYSFTVDDVKFTHLGDLGENFSSNLVDRIGKTDVLFIPIGGNYTIDYPLAKKFADNIDAKIIVPMHYKTTKSTIDVDDCENFISLCETVNYCKQLQITKNDLPDEKTVYVFDTSNF